MVGGTKDRYIFVEQVNLLIKHIPSMVWLTLLTGAVISLVFIGKVPLQLPVLWFGGVVLYCGVRLWHYYSLKHEKITVDNVTGHGIFFVAFSFVSGATWGILGMILPILSDPYLMVLTALLLCGMVAGSVSFLSIYKPAYLAFALPCALPFSIRCIMSQQEIPVAIGILLLMFLAINLFHSHLTEINVLVGINLVLENKELIQQLEYEKANLDKARKLAEQNNKSKSRFLATASHDLRQPLHAMGFFVEALLQESNPVKIREYSQKIGNTSEALMSLLSSLLDISKIEAGVMEPHREHFILNDVLQEINQEYTELAEGKGLNLNFMPCYQVVYSDKVMFGRILRNLVSNAIRYTEHGFVNVRWENDGNAVVLYVTDSGSGIPDSCREEIFEEFFRIPVEKEKSSKGLGLGLSIVDGLCRLLGHQISLQSEVGIGSVFSVKIPLGKLNLVTPDKAEINVWSGDVSAKILILNYEESARESISEIMRVWGHTVADFYRGTEALQYMEAENFIPDLLISDIQLEDGAGIDFIKEILAKHDKEIPAIIMTGDGEGANVDRMKANGFAVLQKPVQPAKLRSTVSYLVRELN